MEKITQFITGLYRILKPIVIFLFDLVFNKLIPFIMMVVLGFISGLMSSGNQPSSGSSLGGIQFPSAKSMNDTNRLFRDTLNDHNWTRKRP